MQIKPDEMNADEIYNYVIGRKEEIVIEFPHRKTVVEEEWVTTHIESVLFDGSAFISGIGEAEVNLNPTNLYLKITDLKAGVKRTGIAPLIRVQATHSINYGTGNKYNNLRAIVVRNSATHSVTFTDRNIAGILTKLLTWLGSGYMVGHWTWKINAVRLSKSGNGRAVIPVSKVKFTCK